MSKIYSTLLVTMIVALLTGCGPSSLQNTSTSGEPSWYRKPPTSKEYIYGVFTAASQDMQLAYDKAAAGARTDIGKQVEVQIQALQKRFDEETGFGKDAQLLQQFTEASKVIVNTRLTSTRIKEKVNRRDGDNWRAYVLVEYPISEANNALVKEIKKNEQLLTRIRSSEAFKELEKEVEKDNSGK